MPAVSVVIPLFKARDVIQETVQSVLAQPWKDSEIVVEDGSTAGAATWCGRSGRREVV